MKKLSVLMASLIAAFVLATGMCASAFAAEAVDKSLPVPHVARCDYWPSFARGTCGMSIICPADKSDSSYSGYQVYVSESSDFISPHIYSLGKDWGEYDFISFMTESSYSGQNLGTACTQYIKVRSYKNASGDTGISADSKFGAWGETFSVYIPDFEQRRAGEATYSYKFYALSDAHSTLYDGVEYPIYLQTNNPDSNSILIELDGDTVGSPVGDQNSYIDIPFSSKFERGQEDLRAVPGGYIWFYRFDDPGTHTLRVREYTRDGYVVAASYELNIADYSKAKSAWIDSIIAKTTTGKMDKFEKMEAVSNYLLDNFKYLTGPDGKHLATYAAVPNSPFFVANRWDSYVSPAILCQFAERIGGFTTIDNLYGMYSKYNLTWEGAHWMVACSDGTTTKMYGACPTADTGIVKSSGTIDLSNPKNLYTIKGLKEAWRATLPAFAYVKTGSAIQPEPIVKVGSTTLKKGTDYTVSYKDNKEIGTATVTVTGKGSYAGKTEVMEFVIASSVEALDPTLDYWEYESRTDNAINYWGTWKKENGAWRYAESDGRYVANVWAYIDNKIYHFNKSGYMDTGWIELDGKRYFLDSNGVLTTGWFKDKNKWYYATPVFAELQTGWYMEDGGIWYHFDKTGAMQTGWQKIGKKWYHFASSGKMHTAWTKVGKKWYYFHDQDGDMKTGWVHDGKNWYYMGGKNDGTMKTGWIKSGKKWYYLKKSGAMASNRWVGNYYVGNDGHMLTSRWIGNYWVGSDGAWVPGKK